MVYVRGCKGVIKGVQGGLRRAYWVCECMQRGHMGCVKTYVIDVNTFHTSEEGAHSPGWPNRLIIVMIYLYC